MGGLQEMDGSRKKWPLVYVDIIEGHPAKCPVCGGSVRHSFFAGENRLGFGILECEDCTAKYVLSRVVFPDSVTDVKPLTQ